MADLPFGGVIDSKVGLRERYREPAVNSMRKEVDRLDRHCRDFIDRSPFVILSTAAADGRCDVSPKGGPPGFVRVLDDHRLALPDLTGNNRLDSIQNIVENPHVALLFLIPGLDETLRVNGRASVVVEEQVLDRCVVHGRRPASAIGVQVEQAFLHCAKALRRGDVWQPDAWPDRTGMASPACILRDHIDQPELTTEAVEAALAESYTERLW
jgi:PPOX class probable FMN-dependent enzyme